MRVLVIGSLGGPMATASRIALDRGSQVTAATDVDQALEFLRSGSGIVAVFVDISLNVHRLVRQMEAERMATPVIACGVDGVEAEVAVAAIEAGAREYLPLPPEAELIATLLSTFSDLERSVVCHDPVMKKVFSLADRIAQSPASVLITGESGTGKEVIARYIHDHSRRRDRMFIAINCAAIPENLLESELFGHEKGAFSGAIARRIGRFEEAQKGTLLLDEISEMSLPLQAKLLRVLQEREIDRVGGSKPISLDVRVLATSNRHMKKSVQEGHFREDLYFRLNVVNIALPPLRERPGDVEALAHHFIKTYAQINQVSEPSLTKGAMVALKQHRWPGNVRELENTMHRAVLLADKGRITESSLMLEMEEKDPNTSPSSLVGQTMAQVEKQLIQDTLQHCLGNSTQAARILGVSIRTLHTKLNTYQHTIS